MGDFVTSLPLELVVYLLTFLNIDDVFCCMKVCRRWYDKIRSLDSYWRTAVKTLGVSPKLVHTVGIGDHFTLALKVWKGRQYIASSEPEVARASSTHHRRIYFHCTYCRHGTLVATLYEDFFPIAILVYKIQPGSNRLTIKNRFPPVLSSPLGRVCWSNVYCDYLLLATACGRWFGYSLATNVKLLDWKGPDLYDQDVLVCCCDDCYVVVLAKFVPNRKPMESYWDINTITLGRGYTQPKVYHYFIRTNYLTLSNATRDCQKIAIVSKIGQSTAKTDCCTSHWLLLQSSCHLLTIHEICHSHGQINLIPLKVFDYQDTRKDRDVFIQQRKYCHSPFQLSFDNCLVGFIFEDNLHVWNLHTLTHESSVSIQRSNKDAQVCLLGLGRIYSLIGYESINGQLKVVSTYSGKSIFSTHGFSGVFKSQPQQTIGTPPPYFIFLGVVDEHWLNHTEALPPSLMPVFLYWEKRERCVFGIVFKRHKSISTPNIPHNVEDQTRISKFSSLKKRLTFS